MIWKAGQWRWLSVRHTEDQQHSDWVLYHNAENGQAPRAVAECEWWPAKDDRPEGQWLWRVQSEEIGGRMQTGLEPSADEAMKSATAFVKKQWEGKANA